MLAVVAMKIPKLWSKKVEGDLALIDAVSGHVEDWIGDPEMVLHEEVSEFVHVDIHLVRATDALPYHACVTSGCSELPMKSASHPNGLWTELILCLPAEVDFDRLANLEACRRPLNFLRLLARYPHMINTMIWEGHTIPLPEQFEDDTMPFDAVMLVKPYCFDPQGSSFDFDGHRIYFHQLVFLKEDEVAFKLKYGFEKLMDLANDQDRLDELLIFDPARLELSL